MTILMCNKSSEFGNLILLFSGINDDVHLCVCMILLMKVSANSFI
jgi:hypothetical protein